MMIKQFLRSEQDTEAVRRRVRRLPRSQSTESSGRGEGSNSGLQRSGAAEGTWTWYGAWEGTRQGDLLAPFTTHVDELNKMMFEDRCAVVKTFHLTHCRVTLAIEVPSLRSVVGKVLLHLHGERKYGQCPQMTMARELQHWLEVMNA